MNPWKALIALSVVMAGGMVYFWMGIADAKRDNERMSAEIAALNGRLAASARVVDSLRALTPGLGEYMSTIQLHAAKLWFAALNANWALAEYEAGELAETMEAAEGLHAVKNKVDVTAVLQSVRQTQLANLGDAIRSRDFKRFNTAYSETLSACNGCHRPAGFEFIHIITPTQLPVANQDWKPAKNTAPATPQP